MRHVPPVLLVALLASGCGLFASETIAVGSCLQRGAADEDGRTAVAPAACDRPHDLEVVGLLEADELGQDFPGDDALSRWALQRCVEAFEEHVGVAYGRSALEIDVAAPDERQWDDGRRDVRCSAMSLDGQPLDAPVGQ